MPTTDADLAHVMRLERELQTRPCRNDQARVHALLAPDFTEIGASGRFWDRQGILALLAEEANDVEEIDAEEIEVRNLQGRVIADGLILLHWDSVHRGRQARRSSLWRNDPTGWHLVHHQGTPAHHDQS